MTVGLGIVGTGRWAGAHARAAARSSQVHIVHCASRSDDRRVAFADEHSIERRSASLNDLLTDPAVEAVVISTPNDLHVPMALAALKAGKPVLVDKPVTVDLADGLALARAVRETGLALGVGHHARRLAGHRVSASWLKDTRSTVRLAYANFSNARGAAMKPDAWHRTATGFEAGVLIQVGIHPIDTVLGLVGPATEVNARFSFGIVAPDIPDTAAVTIQHTSGATSVVATNWSTPSNYTLDLLTTQGNLLFRADHAYWTSPEVDTHSQLLLDRDGAEPVALATNPGDPLRDQLDELAVSISDPSAMTVNVWDGLRAMGVVVASVESNRHNGTSVSMASMFSQAGATDTELATLIG